MRGLIAAALLAVAGAAWAEHHKGPKGPGEPDPKQVARHHAEMLTEHLGLTPEQAKKVGAILEESAGEQAALAKKLHEHERKTHESLRALLNDEQKEKFDMFRARRKMMMGRGMRHKMRQEPGHGDADGGDDDDDRPGVMIDEGDGPKGPPRRGPEKPE